MARPKAIVPVAQDQPWIRMLVYGDPGVGKTVLIGTSPRGLILDADKGSESAAAHGSKASKWNVSTWDELEQVQEYLRHEGHEEFDWVWLDSISLFQEMGLDQIMAELVEAKPHRKVYLPDKGEYGQNMNRLGLWVRSMKAVPVHFGITAHTLRSEDDDGRVLYLPAVQGKNMPDKISAHMGIVGYMYAKRKDGTIHRYLRTTKDAKHYAKDRYAAINGVMEAPTVPKIMEAVQAAQPQAGTTARRRPVKKAARPQKRS